MSEFIAPKKIQAVDIRTDKTPYLVSGENLTSMSEDAYLISKGSFTTHDSSNPDFHLQARTIRMYEHDRVVFSNVVFSSGKFRFFGGPISTNHSTTLLPT